MSYSYQKGFSWLSVFLGILIPIAIVSLLAPMTLNATKAGHRTKSLSNAKSIAAGLMTFKEEFGNYPCEKTHAILVREGPKFRLPHLDAVGVDFLPPLKEIEIDFPPKGDSSNAYFAQLLASGAIESEMVFFAPGMKNFREGDDQKNTRETILAAGENSFAYIMAPNGKPLTDIHSFTPLIVAPVIANGSEPIFDPGPFAGEFVFGRADGSVATGDIDENGHAISEGLTSFFQTGPNSLFGTDTPVVKCPLKP